MQTELGLLVDVGVVDVTAVVFVTVVNVDGFPAVEH
jgi:hypothetical protein